jgi:hypothetical protein
MKGAIHAGLNRGLNLESCFELLDLTQEYFQN